MASPEKRTGRAVPTVSAQISFGVRRECSARGRRPLRSCCRPRRRRRRRVYDDGDDGESATRRFIDHDHTHASNQPTDRPTDCHVTLFGLAAVIDRTTHA